MDPVDMVLAQKEKQCRKRLLEKKTRKAKEAERMQQADMNAEFSSSSEDEIETSSNE